jgi:hypothetical protein
MGCFLSSKQRFSEFLETVWQSGNADVGLSGFMETKVSPKVELAVLDSLHGFEQVGMRPQTNRKCGTFSHLFGCSDVEAHAGVTIDGVLCTGKVYMPSVFYSCDKPTCKICFRDGWARRGSYKMGLRLEQASKVYGECYHIIASVPPKDYDLPYDVQCENTRKALAKRHVIGGCMTVHAVRADKRKFSIHFHVLGFIENNGYDKCRHCKGADCHVCDGFEGLTMRLRKADGYIIKVLEERKKAYGSDKPNIGGTAFYELTHASVLKNVERFHVWTWFGVCGYNKMKVEEEVKRMVCPICKQGCFKHVYTGSRPLSDFKRGVSVRVCLFDAEEGGVKVFAEVGGGSCKSPSANMRDGVDTDV